MGRIHEHSDGSVSTLLDTQPTAVTHLLCSRLTVRESASVVNPDPLLFEDFVLAVAIGSDVVDRRRELEHGEFCYSVDELRVGAESGPRRHRYWRNKFALDHSESR